jgi:hypothetical protein
MADSAKRPWRFPAEPEEDYYTVLGVKRGDSQQEISKAYRRLVRKCHPDAQPDDPHSRQQFIKLQTAFEVLSDPAERAIYDRTDISFATTRKPKDDDQAWSVSYNAPPKRPRWVRDPCAVDLVRWPAICLLLIGLMGIPVGIYVANRVQRSLEHTLQEAVSQEADLAYRQHLCSRMEWESILRTIGVLSSILVIVGAINMLALRIHGLAVIVSVLVMLPCVAPCFGLGLVFGIWAVVRLSDEIVKRAFRV